MYIILYNKNYVTISYKYKNIRVPKEHSRGSIKEFSRKSRSRLMRFITSTENYEYIYTLTFPDWVKIDNDKMHKVKRALEKKFQSLNIDYIYKLEFTKKKVPHIHYILYNSKNKHQIIKNYVINKIIKYFNIDDEKKIDKIKRFQSDDRVFQKIRNLDMVLYYCFYFSKSKEYQNDIPEGYKIRFWGYSKGVKKYLINSEIMIFDDNDTINSIDEQVELIKASIGINDKEYIKTITIYNFSFSNEYEKTLRMLSNITKIRNFEKFIPGVIDDNDDVVLF